jgi:uncharacterized repeat protein (TIGR01451 family)
MAMRETVSFSRWAILLIAAATAALAFAAPGSAQLVLIDSHQFTWTDPASGGVVLIREEVYRGCADGHPNETTFRYHVVNQSYDPVPGSSNGFSGFQIQFPGPIPDLHNQTSPAVGGPWEQNAFSGVGPPFGVEWDVPNDEGNGILVGQSGDFSYCTAPRDDVVVNDPPANPSGFGPFGWGHTWISNGQSFIFNGPNSIPGRLLIDLGQKCSDGELVCKSVVAKDADGDGIIELGEETVFTFVITVHNPGPGTWTDVTVKDNLAGDIELHSATPSQGTVSTTLTGKSQKVHLLWDVGTLGPGATASLVLVTSTDENPAGHQEFTSCGVHELNSGSTLKFIAGGHQSSAGTGGISTRVWCAGTLFAGSDTEDFAGLPLPDRLARMETLGPFVQSTTIETADVYLNGIESNGAGNLFSGDPLTSAQDIVSPTGDLLSAGVGPLPALCCNEDIAFDGVNLWRAHWSEGPLFVFSPAGVVVATYDQTDVVGATFVGSTLWLTKWGAQQVGTFDPGTNTFTPVFSTAPNNAGGLAYDAANNLLWVGRQGGMIEAWSLDGPTPTLVAGSGTQPFGAIGDTIDGVAFIG